MFHDNLYLFITKKVRKEPGREEMDSSSPLLYRLILFDLTVHPLDTTVRSFTENVRLGVKSVDIYRLDVQL